MPIEMDDRRWESIDEDILRGAILPALKAIREAAGLRVHPAMAILRDRYNMLREERPSEFVSEPGEYWEEFYS